MPHQGFLGRLLNRLQWRPLQIWLKHYRSAEIDLSAIAVAYYMLLTIFPLIVLAANIFPYLDLDVEQLLKFMKNSLPSEFYGSAALVTRNIFARPSTGILGVATVTAIWTLSRSLSSLQKAFNKAYGSSSHRDVILSRIIGAVVGIGILFLLTFALMLSTFSRAIINILKEFYAIKSSTVSLVNQLTQPITIGVIFIALLILYFVLPNVKIKRLRYVLPGSLFTTAFLALFSNLISSYILHTLGRFIDIKTFGSVMIFIIMVWFIFLAHILILGSVLNATIQELSLGNLESRKGDVLTILQSRKQEQQSSEHQ